MTAFGRPNASALQMHGLSRTRRIRFTVGLRAALELREARAAHERLEGSRCSDASDLTMNETDFWRSTMQSLESLLKVTDTIVGIHVLRLAFLGRQLS
jgi:hypothetical protein